MTIEIIESIVNVCERLAHEELVNCEILPSESSDKHGDARAIIRNSLQECLIKYIEYTENDMLKTHLQAKEYLGLTN